MTQIVNQSLNLAAFPDCFKLALLNPLLKKPTLDVEVLSNFRPISNLMFMSKLTEKVVASQLINHISSHGLDEILQLTQQYNHNLLNNFWDLTTQNNLMTTISTQALENLYINLQQHPNGPRSIYQYSSMAPRLSGQNCKFFNFLLSLNSPKRLGYKENNTKYRILTRKPRSHVRILIYRTWPISAAL